MPTIQASWVLSEGVQANINILILTANNNDETHRAQVDANAWMDEDREGGKIRLRRWDQFFAGTTAFDAIYDELERAFVAVKDITPSHLTKEKALQPHISFPKL